MRAAFFLIILSGTFAIGSVQGQTQLTETTWGGIGNDVADGVASAADGSSYVVGITDSFTTDPFGNPSRDESYCGNDDLGRKHDVQRKRRGGIRKNRAISTSYLRCIIRR